MQASPETLIMLALQFGIHLKRSGNQLQAWPAHLVTEEWQKTFSIAKQGLLAILPDTLEEAQAGNLQTGIVMPSNRMNGKSAFHRRSTDSPARRKPTTAKRESYDLFADNTDFAKLTDAKRNQHEPQEA